MIAQPVHYRGPIGTLSIARLLILAEITMVCAGALILGIGQAQARDSDSFDAQILQRLNASIAFGF
jgi:hypothetical protein